MTYRLLTYLAQSGPRSGILAGGAVYDAQALTGKISYATVLGILDDWETAGPLLAPLAKDGLGSVTGIPLAETSLLAPVQYPGQIWAAGANYQDHIAEMAEGSEYKTVNAKAAGGRPWFFSKTSRGAIIGHDEARPLPYYSNAVDWEIELAVVIGRPAYRVPAENALDYVAGYTIANDLSARDHVVRPTAAPDSPFRFDWLSHKGFDGACPMGPWITPASEITDPQNLDLKLWIDDQLMQDSNTRHMIFTVAEQIAEISARVTMHPGDVILTGTPSGVGMGRNIFLRSGQKLRLYIEQIGELRHSFL
jgi:2-keto-4-pentenoate hydratase/2-oxohepta-3-ene-1,7-dioic acid hydratase in catechol pathway